MTKLIYLVKLVERTNHVKDNSYNNIDISIVPYNSRVYTNLSLNRLMLS